jgi:ribonuclease P protein component
VPLHFRRRQRLLTAADFARVFSAADVKSGQNEVLLLARFNDRPEHRLGLAVAKKHLPGAVQRNCLKRLSREAFRTLEPTQPNLDIIVLSRPGARGASKEDLRGALAQQFSRLRRRAARNDKAVAPEPCPR